MLDLDFEVDPEQALSELREDEESLGFYMKRADYYKAVGYGEHQPLGQAVIGPSR